MNQKLELTQAVKNNPALKADEVEAYRVVQLRRGRRTEYTLVPPLADAVIVKRSWDPTSIRNSTDAESTIQ